MKILTDEDVIQLLDDNGVGETLADGNGLTSGVKTVRILKYTRAVEAAVVAKIEDGWINLLANAGEYVERLRELGFVRLKPGQVIAERRVIDSGEGNWHYELSEVNP